MKLMTKQLETNIPKIGSTEYVENPEIKTHYFNPCGRGDWYVLEGEKQTDGNWLFFGYVKSPITPDFDGLGYFTLKELDSVKLPFGLGIEREVYWNEKPLKEVM